MPPRESFVSEESYCATLAHELIHWTAHPSRLVRELGKRFGDQAYAAEELIAEMRPAFLCSDLSITPEVREDHAQYLATCLGIPKDKSGRAPPAVGWSLPVLFENEGRHEGTLFGRTRHLQAVRASGPARLVGQEVPVNITAAGTNSLKGKAETL